MHTVGSWHYCDGQLVVITVVHGDHYHIRGCHWPSHRGWAAHTELIPEDNAVRDALMSGKINATMLGFDHLLGVIH